MSSDRGGPKVIEAPEPIASRLLDILVVTTRLSELLAEISDLAVDRIPGCGSASITVIHQTTPATAASSDSRARSIDESQYRAGQGPCVQAARSGRPVRVDDIATTAPDPLWRSVAQDAHITATLSVPLITSANIDAALNLYTDHDGGWPEHAYDTAEDLATHAANAITIAYRMTHRDPDPTYWPYAD
jgi:GAF domain-containing protein